MSVAARVTVGMPVYNGAATVERALRSLLTQTHRELEIVVADNASTDDTVERCRALAGDDPRVRFVLHERNLGAVKNFSVLLENVQTPYFMFAAADDEWEPEFVEANLAGLEADGDAVASISRVDFVMDGEVTRRSHATEPLLGDSSENLRRFLSDPADNSRFYALFRSEVMVEAYPDADFYGLDWAVSALTAARGRHLEVPRVLMRREDSPPHRYQQLAERSATGWLERWLPLLTMTRFLWKRLGREQRRAAFWTLIRLNRRAHGQYLAYRLRSNPLLGPLGRFLLRVPGVRALLGWTRRN